MRCRWSTGPVASWSASSAPPTSATRSCFRDGASGVKAVITGAAGMIGSNLVHGLNAIGIDEVIAVDDLSDGPKYRNLLGAQLSDYFDKSEFYARFAKGEFGKVDAVF